MALNHKWGVKTGLAFALQFFMLISDSLGGVSTYLNDYVTKLHEIRTYLLVYYDV